MRERESAWHGPRYMRRTHGGNSCGWRPHKCHAGGLACAREARILAQEAVAWVHRPRACAARCLQQCTRAPLSARPVVLDVDALTRAE